MKTKLLVALLPLVALSPAPASAAPAAMQPGLWEITMKMEMPGMPIAMPPQTIQHCYTKKDLEDGKNTVPQSEDKNCKITDYKIQGNTVTWSVICTGENAMSGSGTMTMAATSYSGMIKAKMKEGGQTMEMTQRLAGKRLGECK